MTQRKVTIVISDLHIGGGAQDPGDDFIYQGEQFPKMLRKLGSSPEAAAGKMELFINGDFLEFAQTATDVYKLNSSKYWCTEAESLRKLDQIMAGHPEVFKALADFQRLKNAVTITGGNHDIDLYWPEVQRQIRTLLPDVEFELGSEWMTRYGGKLRISHGNQIDPANRFEHWDNPIMLADHGQLRLEMCPGTLFMVKFVNWLQHDYPFANNLHPVTKIAGVLAREDRYGFTAAAWMFARFGIRNFSDFLGKEGEEKAQTDRVLLDAVKYDQTFRKRLVEVYRVARSDPDATPQTVAAAICDENALAQFMADSLAAVDTKSWLELFSLAKPDVLSTEDGTGETLALIWSGAKADTLWRDEAAKQWKQGAEVVVIGHTHLPEQAKEGGKAYYNPGCWTRYVTGEQLAGLRLADLKQEEKFPYQLNYVRVAEKPEGGLESEMICVEERKSFG